MKTLTLPWISVLASVLVIPFAAPVPACADTYQVFIVGNDNGYEFVGMDDFGHVVTESVGGSPGGNLYVVYTYGVETDIIASPTAPVFNYDSHAASDPMLVGTDFMGFQVGFFIYANSLGDIVFNDPLREDWVLVEDVTNHVPESSSLVLLGVGLLSAIGRVRRRRV